MVEACDRAAAEGFANELDVFTLDVSHYHDFDFVKEVDGEVGDGVAEDRFLDEQDVAAGFFYLFDYVEDVGAFFFEDAVHCGVIGHDYVMVHLNEIKITLERWFNNLFIFSNMQKVNHLKKGGGPKRVFYISFL